MRKTISLLTPGLSVLTRFILSPLLSGNYTLNPETTFSEPGLLKRLNNPEYIVAGRIGAVIAGFSFSCFRGVPVHCDYFKI